MLRITQFGVPSFQQRLRSSWRVPGLVIGAAIAILPGGALAQGSPQPTAPTVPAAATPQRMERLSGVWIDGPGYDIVYGGPYDACAARCAATSACAMIEYYRPEKKCNMYKVVRPRLKGGSSDVAIKR
jgi:hypothetical protein